MKAGTPVAVGGGDGSCAGVGVGCIKPGTAYNYLGSSSWIALTVKQPIVDEQMRTMNWAHCVPGYLHPSGTMQTAGSSFHWLKEVICTSECADAAERGASPYAVIDEAIKQSPPGANGILFLPYMLGERTPWWNPNARGAFIGLNLASKREDMLRAVMEGITMNLGIIVNIFRQHVADRCHHRHRRRGAERGVAADDGGHLRLPHRVAELPGRSHFDGRGGDRRRGGRVYSRIST